MTAKMEKKKPHVTNNKKKKDMALKMDTKVMIITKTMRMMILKINLMMKMERMVKKVFELRKDL